MKKAKTMGANTSKKTPSFELRKIGFNQTSHDDLLYPYRKGLKWARRVRELDRVHLFVGVCTFLGPKHPGVDPETMKEWFDFSQELYLNNRVRHDIEKYFYLEMISSLLLLSKRHVHPLSWFDEKKKALLKSKSTTHTELETHIACGETLLREAKKDEDKKFLCRVIEELRKKVQSM